MLPKGMVRKRVCVLLCLAAGVNGIDTIKRQEEQSPSKDLGLHHSTTQTSVVKRVGFFASLAPGPSDAGIGRSRISLDIEGVEAEKKNYATTSREEEEKPVTINHVHLKNIGKLRNPLDIFDCNRKYKISKLLIEGSKQEDFLPVNEMGNTKICHMQLLWTRRKKSTSNDKNAKTDHKKRCWQAKRISIDCEDGSFPVDIPQCLVDDPFAFLHFTAKAYMNQTARMHIAIQGEYLKITDLDQLYFNEKTRKLGNSNNKYPRKNPNIKKVVICCKGPIVDDKICSTWDQAPLQMKNESETMILAKKKGKKKLHRRHSNTSKKTQLMRCFLSTSKKKDLKPVLTQIEKPEQKKEEIDEGLLLYLAKLDALVDLVEQQYEALETIKLEFDNIKIPNNIFYNKMKERKYADKIIITTVL